MRRMMSALNRTVFIAIFAAFVLNGCKGTAMQPDKPAVMIRDGASTNPNDFPLLPYTLKEFKDDKKKYNDAADAASAAITQRVSQGTVPTAADVTQIYANARFYRDIMINRIRADIRANSGEFEDMLRENIAKWATGADILELSLAAATTITGGEQSKTVLAAILTAIKGGRISVDKNFFREKTSEAIISALRSSRLKLDTAIVGKMSTLGAEKYTFEESWNDLVDLYYAGTLASGFQTLAEGAATEARMAEAKKDKLDAARSPLLAATAAQISLARRFGDAIVKMSPENAKAILDKMKVTVPANESAKEVLKESLVNIPVGDPKLDEYVKAFDDVLGKEKW